MGVDDLNGPGRDSGEPDEIDPAQVLDEVQRAVDRLRRRLAWAAGRNDDTDDADAGMSQGNEPAPTGEAT